MKPDDGTSGSTAPDEPTEHEAGAAKPSWSRPEITSFKPVADAQGISYRIGDGVSNLS